MNFWDVHYVSEAGLMLGLSMSVRISNPFVIGSSAGVLLETSAIDQAVSMDIDYTC